MRARGANIHHAATKVTAEEYAAGKVRLFSQLNKNLKFSEKRYIKVHIKYLYKNLDIKMFKWNENGKIMQKSL